LLLALSIRPLSATVLGWFDRGGSCGCGSQACGTGDDHNHDHTAAEETDCNGSCKTGPPVTLQPLSTLNKKDDT